MLWNQQHSSYLHYVLIPSEPEHFTFDKLIPEALQLLEAPSVVRLVHLYKLLCGVTFDSSSSSNALTLRVFLRQETGKTRIEPCEGCFVTETAVECGLPATSAAKLGPSSGVRCNLPRNRPAFLGH
jgi:hypothetical protein